MFYVGNFPKYLGGDQGPGAVSYTHLVITCDSPSGSDLGTKTSGFSISYQVDDADGDAVTVTEQMDSTTKRSYAATLEATNQFQVTGSYFQQLLNGQHTMKMLAQDAGRKSSE